MLAPDPGCPFAFVEDLDHPALSDDERHHLERVRRLRVGDALTVGDGAGRWRAARFGPALDGLGEILSTPAPTTLITVGFALTKGDKPELVVQKLVEIGVDRIVPFVAERTVVRWDDAKAARNVDRWRVIAREAAAQAHRPRLAEVTEVRTFATLVAEAGDPAGLALAHLEGVAIGASRPTTILVGPEGGWSPSELAAVERRVRLGPHVLRAETAALVAGALAVVAHTP